MRKILLMALCFLVLGSTAFALDLVIGGGGLFGYTFEQYEIYDEDEYLYRNDNNAMVFGGFAFFGTHYTEFNFSVRYSQNDLVYIDDGEKNKDNTLMLSVGAYGKFPFLLGTKFVLFPTLGVDFDAVDDFTYLWLRGGLGLDIFFTERFFLRGQALYGYAIEPFLLLSKATDLNYNSAYEKVTPGHGPFFKLGIGWMF